MIYEVYRDDGRVDGPPEKTRRLLGFNTYDVWKKFVENFDPKQFENRVRPRLIHTFHVEDVSYYNEQFPVKEKPCEIEA